MEALQTFFLLLALVGSVRGSCREANWWEVLDQNNVWATCNANEYMNGLWRNDRGFLNLGETVGKIEYAKCCSARPSYGNKNADCLNADWWAILDGNNVWAVCPAGRYMQGFYKSDDQWLHNIEQGKCCKPPGHPNNWGECYEQDVTISFDGKGWSSCSDGYYMVGLYRGICDKLFCLEKFKCCKMAENRINGGWSSFGAWGACSKTCGRGSRSRFRTCTNPPPANGGAQCSGSNIETEDCANQGCPVNGGWGAFGRWGPCSKSCGGGRQKSSRVCNNPAPAYGGKYCVGPAEEFQACNEQPCRKAVNGGWSKWSAYGKCNKPCGKGKKYKTRTCTNPPPSNGGKKCKGKSKKGKRCNAGKC